MSDPFILPAQPDSVEHRWTWFSDNGPVTADGSGEPMRVDRLVITEFANEPGEEPEVLVEARGNFLTKTGKRDKRYAEGTAYANLDWKEAVLAQWLARRAEAR